MFNRLQRACFASHLPRTRRAPMARVSGSSAFLTIEISHE